MKAWFFRLQPSLQFSYPLCSQCPATLFLPQLLFPQTLFSLAVRMTSSHVCLQQVDTSVRTLWQVQGGTEGLNRVTDSHITKLILRFGPHGKSLQPQVQWQDIVGSLHIVPVLSSSCLQASLCYLQHLSSLAAAWQCLLLAMTSLAGTWGTYTANRAESITPRGAGVGSQSGDIWRQFSQGALKKLAHSTVSFNLRCNLCTLTA